MLPVNNVSSRRSVTTMYCFSGSVTAAGAKRILVPFSMLVTVTPNRARQGADVGQLVGDSFSSSFEKPKLYPLGSAGTLSREAFLSVSVGTPPVPVNTNPPPFRTPLLTVLGLFVPSVTEAFGISFGGPSAK